MDFDRSVMALNSAIQSACSDINTISTHFDIMEQNKKILKNSLDRYPMFFKQLEDIKTVLINIDNIYTILNKLKLLDENYQNFHQVLKDCKKGFQKTYKSFKEFEGYQQVSKYLYYSDILDLSYKTNVSNLKIQIESYSYGANSLAILINSIEESIMDGNKKQMDNIKRELSTKFVNVILTLTNLSEPCTLIIKECSMINSFLNDFLKQFNTLSKKYILINENIMPKLDKSSQTMVLIDSLISQISNQKPLNKQEKENIANKISILLSMLPINKLIKDKEQFLSDFNILNMSGFEELENNFISLEKNMDILDKNLKKINTNTQLLDEKSKVILLEFLKKG